MADTIVPYEVYLKSVNIPFIDINKTKKNFPIKAWNRFVTLDDIFAFYPQIEININDETGIILGTIVNGEGIVIETGLGYKGTDTWLKSKWVWNINQTLPSQTAKKASFINGVSIISMLSEHYLYDSVKTRAWNDTTSNIFSEVLKDFSLTDTKKIIKTETNDKNYYYQINETNSEFLTRLATRAYSSKREYSPFVCFSNCLGEAYFCSIEELFEKDNLISTETYKLTTEKESSVDPFAIRSIDFSQLGLYINKLNYRKKFYKQKIDGNIDGTEVVDISNFVVKEKGKQLFLKDVVGTSTKIFDYQDFGICDDTTELSMFKGFRNGFFINTYLPMRMSLTIPYNAKAATGKLINIEIGSNIEERNSKTSELCGKWLIIKCQHYYDRDGQPSTSIDVGKNKSVVDPSANVLKDYFL